MEMELTFAQQSFAFLASLVMGACLGVLYGLLRFFRFAFAPGRAVVTVLDVLFMLVWALLVFFFSLAFLSGYIRLYVFAGSFLGFLAYRLTAGRLLSCLYRPVVLAVKKLLQKICEKLKIFAKYLLKIAAKVLYNSFRGIGCLRNHYRSRRQAATEKRKNHETCRAAKKKKDDKLRQAGKSVARSEGH